MTNVQLHCGAKAAANANIIGTQYNKLSITNSDGEDHLFCSLANGSNIIVVYRLYALKISLQFHSMPVTRQQRVNSRSNAK